jgi:urea carboxylase
VTSEELLEARADFGAGRFDVRVEPGMFRLRAYEDMLAREAQSIADFRARQSAAFGAERAAWAAAGEFEPRDEVGTPAAPPGLPVEMPIDGMLVTAPMTSNVWKVTVRPGDQVVTGQPMVIIEAMKTETSVLSPCNGTVVDVAVTPGMQVSTGTPLVVLAPA